MSDFLVLGLIPGTPIQITFVLWMTGVVGALIGAGIWFGKRRHLFRDWLIVTVLVVAMRNEPKLL